MIKSKALSKRISRLANRLEVIAKRDFQLNFWRLKDEDEIRALRLEQWEEKYMVPLDWILAQLVPIWKQKFSRYQSGGLGVKMATLVGAKSEEILKAKIAEEFPDGENIEQWKSKYQQQQWDLCLQDVKMKEDWTTPAKAVKEYQQRVQRLRRNREAFQRIAKRRRYRNNPWL